jgi:thioredoxin-dependent peroxiredoxin
MDTSTIFTSGLSSDGVAAIDGGASIRCGSAPQPASSDAAKAMAAPNVTGGDKMRRNEMETVMIRLLACTFVCLTSSWPARAALDIGERAPDFTTPAAMAGSVYNYALADALKKGPVILYFFPAAYSEGCSIEAHSFAEAMPQFEALGATVIGVSGDDIASLSKFSVQVCQSKFPVASDAEQSVMKSYDAVMKTRPEYANRISYVIAPDGFIVFQYMSLSPTKHVEKTLDALKNWSATRK